LEGKTPVVVVCPLICSSTAELKLFLKEIKNQQKLQSERVFLHMLGYLVHHTTTLILVFEYVQMGSIYRLMSQLPQLASQLEKQDQEELNSPALDDAKKFKDWTIETRFLFLEEILRVIVSLHAKDMVYPRLSATCVFIDRKNQPRLLTFNPLQISAPHQMRENVGQCCVLALQLFRHDFTKGLSYLPKNQQQMEQMLTDI